MKKTLAFIFYLAVLTSVAMPYKTFAGWPIGKHRHIVIPSFTYYSQTNKFDQNGKIIKGQPGVNFSSYSTSLYVGYGISRRLDFITTLPLLYQVNNLGKGNTIINQGAGDLVTGLSYNLVNFNYAQYLSVQVSGVIPLYTNVNGTSALGLGNYGSEVKLMYSGNLPVANRAYFNTELAYRRYFNFQGPDQVSFLATAGFWVSTHNQLNFNLLFFRSYSSNTAFNSNFFTERDYAFFKPQLNWGHQFTRRFSIFVGGYYVPIGLNTGVGYGGSVLTVFKL